MTIEFNTTPQRSALMKRIKSKNTSCELAIRKALWHKGFRYTIRTNDIFGRPDIVFRSSRIAIFIDGDFWHGNNWPSLCDRLSRYRNSEYWIMKIARNRQRDLEVNLRLAAEGWLVFRIWESSVHKDMDDIVFPIITALKSRRHLVGG